MGSEHEYDSEALNALIRAYVACRLAIEALPDLPKDIRRIVEEPVTALCDVVGPEIKRLDPSLLHGE